MFLQRFSRILTLAACLAVTQATAIPVEESHAAAFNDLMARDRATDIGVRPGKNPTGPNGDNMWLGTSSSRKMTFINNSGQDLNLVVWGPQGSFVNTRQPTISVPIASQAQVVVSVQTGVNLNGGFSAVYSDTRLVNGQIFNTWGEFAWTAQGSVTYDADRMVNAYGHKLSVIGSGCVADMNRCVFVCNDPNVQSCTTDYRLQDCSAGSQHGATSGRDPVTNSPTGGCVTSGNLLTVYFR